VDVKFRQGVVYLFPCRDCNERYMGKTKRSLKSRQKGDQADHSCTLTWKLHELKRKMTNLKDYQCSAFFACLRLP